MPLKSAGIAAVAASFFLFSVTAQTTAGRLSGTVVDSSGAGVPDATVTVINTETSQELREKTSAEGRYVIYPLLPGVYNVTVGKQGFSNFTISGLKVDVSASLSRNISLEVGSISQSVSDRKSVV